MIRFIRLPSLRIGGEPATEQLISLNEIEHFSTRIVEGESKGSWVHMKSKTMHTTRLDIDAIERLISEQH